MPDASAADIAPWLQAGGVVGFAGLVYIELRSHRAELKLARKAISRAARLLAILLDRQGRPEAIPVEPSRPVPRAPTNPAVDDADADDADDAEA